jgi:hypothetical protein
MLLMVWRVRSALPFYGEV